MVGRKALPRKASGQLHVFVSGQPLARIAGGSGQPPIFLAASGRRNPCCYWLSRLATIRTTSGRLRLFSRRFSGQLPCCIFAISVLPSYEREP